MFRWSLLFLAICLTSVRPADAADRPNIVLLLADDLGWKDVGFHGSEIQTPHLDRLASGGTQMTQFYVQPVCSPTRGALLTGKYPCRLGLQCGVVRPWAQHGLPVEERVLPQALSEAGYFTAICGKWHLGHAAPEQLPLARGFAHQYGHYNGALDYFTHMRDGGLDWHRNQEGLEEEGYTTTLIGAEAVRLIRGHDFAQAPMFLYVPFNAPHSPLQALEEDLALYESIKRPKRRTFAAMVTCLDRAVGEIVAALGEAGQSENTLILFCSDNGGPTGLGADNGLLRAGKGTLYEGGVRVPAVAHWPHVVPAGARVDGMMHIVDLYPTLLAVAAVTPTKHFEIDGVNQWPVIMGEKNELRHEVLLNTTPFHGAVRLGPWKLVHNGHVTANATAGEGEPSFELFNLKDDPYEKQNVADAHPQKFAKLKTRLQEFTDAAVEPHIPPNKAPADFQVPKVW